MPPQYPELAEVWLATSDGMRHMRHIGHIAFRTTEELGRNARKAIGTGGLSLSLFFWGGGGVPQALHGSTYLKHWFWILMLGPEGLALRLDIQAIRCPSNCQSFLEGGDLNHPSMTRVCLVNLGAIGSSTYISACEPKHKPCCEKMDTNMKASQRAAPLTVAQPKSS